MLQPSAIPSSIPSDLAESLQQTLTGNKTRVLRALGTTISLPTSPRTFILFLLTLTIKLIVITTALLFIVDSGGFPPAIEFIKID